METILFFLLGLIAGGLLCRRGPMGPTGCDGAPGPQGPRGRDGKDSVDHDDYAEPWHQAVTGPRPHMRSLREILEGINNKVDQLRLCEQVRREREACGDYRRTLLDGPHPSTDKSNPS